MEKEIDKAVEKENTLYEKIAASHPSISRGQVWCRHCGHTEKVDPAQALRHGWPKHCGYTMTIDSPEEQKILSTKTK